MRKIVEIIDGCKSCTKCKEWLPIENFKSRPNSRLGYNSQCRSCTNKEANRKYVKKPPRVKVIDGYKSCCSCKELLPFDNFYKSPKIKSGYSSRCISCNKSVRKKILIPKVIDGYKSCCSCKELLPVDNFYKVPLLKSKCGLSSNCKDCSNEKSRLYRLNLDDETKKLKNKQSYEWHLRRSEWDKEYVEKTKIRHYERVKYKLKNDKEYKNKRREYSKEFASNRRKNDPIFNFKVLIGSNIRTAFKRGGFSKTGRTHEILGIDFDGFVEHIETQFSEGMTWDNMGEWQLDHKIPISLGNTKDDTIRLNHYSNFQPLWKIDNILKSNKILPEFEHLVKEYIHN
jgi:hypothetical protein